MATSGAPARKDPAVGEMQRKRVLDAVVAVIAEHGAADASVELVIARARVSRRTFYTHFSGLEQCLIAILYGALERAIPIVSNAFEREALWHDGMRAALAAMLEFFESEPDLTRVCIVETLAGGALAREHREHVMAAFRTLVVHRIEGEVSHASPLASEGTMASVLGIVHARLAARDPQPLLELLGPIMGVIVGPFMDDAGIAREIERGNGLARKMLDERTRHMASSASDGERAEMESSYVPGPLRDPRAHRARLCLSYVAAHPGVNNREVGTGIGVVHRSQVSALLGLLSSQGLLCKETGRPGHPNAWRLTSEGETVLRALDRQR